jgi:hypothetical protein
MMITAEDIEEYDDTVIWCPQCLNRGYKNRIGPKILIGNEPRPDNYEDLWECAVCGFNGDVSQIPKEEQIQNTIEVVDDPSANKTVFESSPRRNFNKTGKPVKRHKRKRELHKDPDINVLMLIYGDRVKVVYDSNP